MAVINSAYDLRFQANFKSPTGRTWTVQIWDRAWQLTGGAGQGTPPYNFKVTDGGINIKYDCEGDEKFAPIVGSKVSLNFIVDDQWTHEFVDDILGISNQTYLPYKEGDVFLVIKQGGATIWYGEFLHDLDTLVDQSRPFPIQLNFTDGIGKLKSIPFKAENVDTNAAEYKAQGHKKVAYWIGQILQHTGHFTTQAQTEGFYDNATNKVAFKTCIRWYNTSMGSYGAPNQTSGSRSVWGLTKCTVKWADQTNLANGQRNIASAYEVLKQICRSWGCRVIFWGGFYYFVQIREYFNPPEIAPGQPNTWTVPLDQYAQRFYADGDFYGSRQASIGNQYWSRFFNEFANNSAPGEQIQKLEGTQYKFLPVLREVKTNLVHEGYQNIFPGWYLPSASGYNGPTATFENPFQMTTPAMINSDQYKFRTNLFIDMNVDSYWFTQNWTLDQITIWVFAMNPAATQIQADTSIGGSGPGVYATLSWDSVNNSYSWVTPASGTPYSGSMNTNNYGPPIDLADGQGPYSPGVNVTVSLKNIEFPGFQAANTKYGFKLGGFPPPYIKNQFGTTINAQTGWPYSSSVPTYLTDFGNPIDTSAQNPPSWSTGFANNMLSTVQPISNAQQGPTTNTIFINTQTTDSKELDWGDVFYGDGPEYWDDSALMVYDGSGWVFTDWTNDNWDRRDYSSTTVPTLNSGRNFVELLNYQMKECQQATLRRANFSIVNAPAGITNPNGRPYFINPIGVIQDCDVDGSGTAVNTRYFFRRGTYSVTDDRWEGEWIEATVGAPAGSVQARLAGGNNFNPGGRSRNNPAITAPSSTRNTRTLLQATSAPAQGATITSLNIAAPNTMYQENFVYGTDYVCKSGDVLQLEYTSGYKQKITLTADVASDATSISFSSITIGNSDEDQLINPGNGYPFITIPDIPEFEQVMRQTKGTVAGFSVDADGLSKGGIEITGWLDSDTMSGTSANSVPTSESVKAYVDTKVASVPKGLSYQGTWNAETNSPTLASGTGTEGYYYIVSVAGTTTIDGISEWKAGDWIIFSNTDVWQKIDQTEGDTLQSVTDRGNSSTNQIDIDTEGVALNANSGDTNTIAIFKSNDNKGFIRIDDNDTQAHLVSEGSSFWIGPDSSTKKFKVNLSSGDISDINDIELSGTVDGVDVAARDAVLTSATESITTNATNISSNTTAISNKADSSALATTNSNVSTNTTNIATNTTDIATNTTNINSKASTSALNTTNTNVSTNTSNITANATDIATNTTNISTNATAITNKADSSALATTNTNVTNNATNISTNATNISNNDTDIATNVTNIAANTTNISNNSTAIGTKASQSDLNTTNTNVTTNATNIASNDTDIANNATAIGTKASQSDLNTTNTNVTNNATNIATNTTNISSNDTDISNLDSLKAPKENPTFTGTVAIPNIADLESAVSTNTAKTGITTTEQTKLGHISVSSAVDLNTMNSGITSNATNVTNLTGNVVTNGTNISTNATNISNNDTDISNLDTNKAPKNNPTFTGTVAIPNIANLETAVAANTDKVTFPGFGTSATKALAGNTTTITSTQADEITANTAKTGITEEQASAIDSNTSNIALKANIASPTFTGTVGGIDKTMVGLSAVDNTSDANKPISTATQTALDAKATTTALSTTNTNVSNNATNISTNATGISENTTTIESNTTAIESNTSSLSGKLSKTGGTMTGNLVIDDGAGATPVLRFTNGDDSNGSINVDSNGKMIIKTGGTTRMKISSSDCDITGNIVVSGTVDGVDIASRDAVLTTATGNISTNATNIGTNTASIESNTTSIETNATAIDTKANTTALNTTNTNVTTNATNIASNTTAIESNTTSIESNTSAIATKANTTALNTTNTNVSTNTSNIETNTTAIEGKQGTITLTTEGTSGAASFEGNVLNIPTPSGGGATSIKCISVGTTTNTAISSGGNVGSKTSYTTVALNTVIGGLSAATPFTVASSKVKISENGTYKIDFSLCTTVSGTANRTLAGGMLFKTVGDEEYAVTGTQVFNYDRGTATSSGAASWGTVYKGSGSSSCILKITEIGSDEISFVTIHMGFWIEGRATSASGITLDKDGTILNIMKIA